MPDEPQKPRIHPATYWLIAAAMIGGVVVAAAYVMNYNHDAQAGWDSLFGTGPAVRPPIDGKLEKDLEATNRDGRTVHLSELKGKVWVASLLYTDCPMGCVPNAANLKRVYDEFADDPRFAMVSFSVNSEGDTDEKIAAFMERQGIDHDNWWYLTAEDDRIERYRGRFFKLSPSRQITDPELVKEYGIIEHDFHVALIDGKANIRGYYHLLNPTVLEGSEVSIGEMNLNRLKRDLRYILDNEMEAAP